MIGSGRSWLDWLADRQGPDRGEWLEAAVRPDRQRGRQLRRGRARPGADRRRARLHRAADPRRALRRLARGRDLPARPRAARRRDARRDHRRRHHAVQRLPDGHDHLGRSGRSSTSRSRTASSSRGSRRARCRCTRSSCSSRCCSARRCSACSARCSRSRSPPRSRSRSSSTAASGRAGADRGVSRRRRDEPPPPDAAEPPRPAAGLVVVAAADQAGERGDPAAEHEARDGRADQDLLAALVELLAPVGDLGDLRAQALDRERRARRGWPRSSAGSPPAVRARPSALDLRARTPAGADRHARPATRSSVPLISCASSIASCGVGGVPFLIEAHRDEAGDHAEDQDQHAGDEEARARSSCSPPIASQMPQDERVQEVDQREDGEDAGDDPERPRP